MFPLTVVGLVRARDLDVASGEAPVVKLVPDALPASPAANSPVVSDDGPDGPAEPVPVAGVFLVVALVLPAALDDGGV